MEWYDPADQPEGVQCEWCQGGGAVARATAYVAGPHPFEGPMETVHHPAECKHCRGTGIYDSALDPTLEHEFRRR
ncbi:hypothetical protein JGS22_007735 [Streptomyces sp. P38-E01]|uniref:Uncharacterized protein n=1 Tax=Streptomyces tardus TaxID=2780544 RepID=A0A949N7J8_9ACTN|nr:hypothetical protein [Streptomyces tardus]MBU7597516.1 hypothetical protein [Streptomyces tardus]